MRNIVIIGNGIAGVTAAIHIRKHSRDNITIISAESDHFFSRTALMYIYMGHMTYEHTKPYEDHFWREHNLHLLRDYVTAIDTTKKILSLRSGSTREYDVLVLATGSQSNTFGWPGQNLDGVQGLYSLQDLQLMEENTRSIRRAVIVGGGLIGVEAAEMLHSRGIPVTFLVRESRYWGNVLPREESVLVERHIRDHHIDLRTETTLDSILPDDSGRVRAIRTTAGEELPCEFVLLAAGVHPNIGLAAASGLDCKRGIRVNGYFETAIPDVYAIGDCAEIVPDDGSDSRIEPLWYAGRAHGQTVAQTILGTRTRYTPGVFFNSAKFFDIEYQTYGTVKSEQQPGEQTLCWQHPDGTKLIRIVYTADAVTGFNLLGVRYRDAVCRQWIEEQRSIEYVLEHLGDANFDPEFFEQYESEVVRQYNVRHPDAPVRLRHRRNLTERLAEVVRRQRERVFGKTETGDDNS